MKANTKSLHYKLYNFTFKPDYKGLPTNLCPYFWKVLFSFIIFIPNLVMQLPILIISIFTKTNIECNEKRSLGLVSYFGIVTLYFIIISNYHLIKYFFESYSYDSELATIGAIINCFIIFGIIIYLLINIYERITFSLSENIIIEFTKGKYGKYCPKIDWN